MTNHTVSALLIGSTEAFRLTGGGVQLCNREFVSALEAANFSVGRVTFSGNNSLRRRLMHKIGPSLVANRSPPGLEQRVLKSLHDSNAEVVFFSQNVFWDLSKRLRKVCPRVKQILISLGVETLDACIAEQIRLRSLPLRRAGLRAPYALGGRLLDEIQQRRWIDATLTLSPFEVDVEYWLGVKAALWVPRTVVQFALPANQVNGRVGCVCTLNHPPNLDGLTRLCEALVSTYEEPLRLRIVGAPESEGRDLARKFNFVEYLGSLNDRELESEASTWCCFVHPLFVNAKGCSTKLAVALGWRLPIATTVFGARGYHWDAASLPLARTPSQLASAVVDRCHTERFQLFQQQTVQIAEATPTLAIVGEQIARFYRELE